MPAHEHAHQVAVVKWLRSHGIMCFAVPNAAKRSYRLAKYLQADGLLAGAPDLMVVTVPPIAVEMKTPTGKLSQAQMATHDSLCKAGWHVVVGYGAKDAVDKLGILLNSMGV